MATRGILNSGISANSPGGAEGSRGVPLRTFPAERKGSLGCKPIRGNGFGGDRLPHEWAKILAVFCAQSGDLLNRKIMLSAREYFSR